MPDAVCRLPLSNGEAALVDADVFAWASQHRWTKAAQVAALLPIGNTPSNEAVAREIMQPPEGFQTDHVNGDKLDNRRANLRVCTRQQNLCNRRKWAGCTSAFKGVNWHRPTGKWVARIGDGHGGQRYLGSFASEESAARAYDAAARAHFGPFARLNFPESAA